MSVFYPRDRAYSSLVQHNVAGIYAFSPEYVNTGNGAGNPVTGNFIPLSADANGYLNVNAGLQFTGTLSANVDNIAVTGGSITVYAATSNAVSANSVSGLSVPNFGIVLPSNATRKQYFIQNLGTGALMVSFSSSIPTTGNLHILLKGATSAWNGDGAAYSESPAIYTGPVSVSGFGGAQCVYRAWEM